MLAGWTTRARLAVPVLAAYWLALFVATHLPATAAKFPGQWDKALHLAAYAGLAFLSAVVVGGRRRLSLPWYLGLWALALVYGAIDELVQIPVGRFASVYDWLADAAGAALGLLLHATGLAALLLAPWPGRPKK